MSYLVGVATSDGENVNVHFGEASRFLVVRVDEQTGAFEPVEWREEPEAPATWGKNVAAPFLAPQGHDAHQVQHAVMAQALGDCEYVLVARIGPHAQKIVAAKGLTPVIDEAPITEAIARLNERRTQGAANKA